VFISALLVLSVIFALSFTSSEDRTWPYLFAIDDSLPLLIANPPGVINQVSWIGMTLIWP
jgi:hypothetical protein